MSGTAVLITADRPMMLPNGCCVPAGTHLYEIRYDDREFLVTVDEFNLEWRSKVTVVRDHGEFGTSAGTGRGRRPRGTSADAPGRRPGRNDGSTTSRATPRTTDAAPRGGQRRSGGATASGGTRGTHAAEPRGGSRRGRSSGTENTARTARNTQRQRRIRRIVYDRETNRFTVRVEERSVS